MIAFFASVIVPANSPREGAADAELGNLTLLPCLYLWVQSDMHV